MDGYLNEDEDFAPLAPSPFSFHGLAADFCNALSGVCDIASEFFGSTAVNFARAHNLAMERRDAIADGEKFASDVLSGLESL